MRHLKARIARLRSRIQLICCCQVPARHRDHVRFPHPVGIVIGDGTKIGRDVRIYQNVTIGLLENSSSATENDYPRLEGEVCVYAGAVIAGPVRIGARSIIGANAVITCDVPSDSIGYGYNQIGPRKT